MLVAVDDITDFVSILVSHFHPDASYAATSSPHPHFLALINKSSFGSGLPNLTVPSAAQK